MAVSWAKEASNFKYDVFLSFSGIDTRKKFTGHLLAALERHGICTFIDERKLNRGENIDPALLNAIEESRISLIVFSKNYAESRWCLDELVKIMECKETFQQTVLPIFYDVEPSDVRAQKGSLAEAFAKHKERFKEGGSNGKVEKWKKALTNAANLSGWDLTNTNEHDAKFIEKIVEKIGDDLSFAYLNVAEHPIGLKSRLKNLEKMVNMDSNDVRIVGIWGIGGIGKTTIAKMLYNLIYRKFEGSSFLVNVSQTWNRSNGPVILQQQLLSEIVKNETLEIRNSNRGIEVIKRRVLCRRVLLVLDDVDDSQQLKVLAIDRNSLRLGSRIIITTRDKSILNYLKVDETYIPEMLDTDESLELFSWNAFKEDHPMKDYVLLSNQVVHYADGLPLALELLGSYFGEIGNDIGDWKCAIEKLRKIPRDDIQGKLKISYDSLENDVKQLFLDIACFFVGMDRDFTIKILEGRNFHAKDGIRNLANRCLVRFGHPNQLEMHNMLRDMGRDIVRQESPMKLGKRSRLWNHEDSLEVLRNGTGAKEVQGLILNFPKSEEVQVSAKAFDNLNGMWLLHLNYVHLRSGFEHDFRGLLWLSWNGCPLEWLPSKLYMEKLVVLDLRCSRLKQVWKGTKNLDKLKFLDLSHCYYLTKTPDFSGLNSLEKLFLNDCIRLAEVDESIECLNKLVVLDMANCENLGQLPLKILMLKSLEYLNLSGCSKLRELAEFKGSPFKSWCTYLSSWALGTKNVDSIGLSLQGSSCLKTLKMSNCNLSHLPCEIGSLISLTDLDIRENNLCTLPDSICNLTRLQSLDMTRCNVSHLPSEIGRLSSLVHWILNENHLCTLPDSICNLTSLERLEMKRCNVSHLPSKIGRLISLRYLILDENCLCTLPSSICLLTNLTYLFLSNCAMLESLPDLPASLEVVRADYCTLEGHIEMLVEGTHMNSSHGSPENNFADKVIDAMIRKNFPSLESSSHMYDEPLDEAEKYIHVEFAWSGDSTKRYKKIISIYQGDSSSYKSENSTDVVSIPISRRREEIWFRYLTSLNPPAHHPALTPEEDPAAWSPDPLQVFPVWLPAVFFKTTSKGLTENSPSNTCPQSDEADCPIQAKGLKKRASTSKGRKRVKSDFEKSMARKKMIEPANCSQGPVVYTPQSQSQPPFAMGSNSVQGHDVYISQAPFVMGGTNVPPLIYPMYDGNNTPQSIPFVYPSRTSFQELLDMIEGPLT